MTPQAAEDRVVAADEVGPLPRRIDHDRLPFPGPEGELAEALLEEHLREHRVALPEERRLARPAKAHRHLRLHHAADGDLDLRAIAVVGDEEVARGRGALRRTADA